jgi:hypothetical protein
MIAIPFSQNHGRCRFQLADRSVDGVDMPRFPPTPRQTVLALLLTALAWSPPARATIPDRELPVDREVFLPAPALPLAPDAAPKRLRERYLSAAQPYIAVAHFRVQPGRKYTLYAFHPGDGVPRNLYLSGDTPITDYTAAYGSSSGVMRGFVVWNQQPFVEKTCTYQATRENFTIAPDSEHDNLFVIATYAKPVAPLKVLLQSNPDPDQDVRTSTVNPVCPARKGFTWGRVWSNPMLLTRIPGAPAPQPVAPAPQDESQASWLPLDVENALPIPPQPLNPSTAPKRLKERYLTAAQPFVTVYRFKVQPGRQYTLYALHPGDGIPRNIYLSGDNPLTDHTASFGPSSGVTRGFVVWNQQPFALKTCAYQGSRENISIAPNSEHDSLYVIATAAGPGKPLKVLLKSMPDNDQEVRASTKNPFCTARNGYTWGRVWGNPMYLARTPAK